MLDAAILCGGQGTRLRPLGLGLPKALAPVGGRAFLDILFENLSPLALDRVVCCIGVGASLIRGRYAGQPGIVFSEEASPLGTGGALRLARTHLRSDPVLVMNGDSLVPGLDWAGFLPLAPAMVLVPADGRTDAGMHAVSEDRRVANGSGHHSAGIYTLPAAWLEEIPAGRVVSLERELLPVWIRRGMHAFVHPGRLFDIGTPDRWVEAQRSLS